MKKLDFKKIKNARDFAGTKNKEGKIIPSGIFIRSGNLANIKFSDKFQLKHKYKIKTIIDLRTEKEVAEKPDKKIRGIKYLNYSLINQSAEGITHEKDRQHSNNLQGLERMYEQIVLDDFAIDSLKKIFKVLTDINNFPILFHCSVGKDRTGIVTLFLLSLLDVERSKIDKDYLESNVICIPESERVYERVLEKTMNHTLANKIRLTHIVDIKYLDAAVNAINEKFGSVDNYIKDVIGITDEEKNIFKENVFNK
ncbi:MAG: tyrosine-protein phosphatase [Bacilli bacterium]|nr:tyrosine-protein phosphatase [Bacilli bacterium]